MYCTGKLTKEVIPPPPAPAHQLIGDHKTVEWVEGGKGPAPADTTAAVDEQGTTPPLHTLHAGHLRKISKQL